ncbi:LysR family transcriptional regulator [Leucobacter tenebrionis]|uniref:LysR family transcriptional regulator n=1 Tax=Leucobacter tenebrionis TaxID=2873270 RepID=UPI001CA75C12|nr:LysR family transcriptional regulator [Leucobacter tenebrionis]QZY50677.1 LysR family transcriptional regulator [Leucobacter tenebrionis]
MFDVQQLITFDAVVREGTFAAAARSLGYTQPGISQQIRALEDRLGAALFVRAGRTLQLTNEGETLAEQAPVLLAALQSAQERVNAVTRLRRGSVRVCAFPSANAALLPPAISHLRSAQLGIEIELFEAEPPESLNGLSQGIYDVVISFHYADGSTPEEHQSEDHDTITVPLLSEPLLLFMNDSHSLTRRQKISLSELSSERWIAGCVRCRQAFIDACAAEGFNPKVDIATDDNLAVQSYVVSGLGLALMPRMVQSVVKLPRLRTRQVSPERVRLVTATFLRSNASSPAVQHLISSLQWAAERLSQGAET